MSFELALAFLGGALAALVIVGLFVAWVALRDEDYSRHLRRLEDDDDEEVKP